MTSNYSYVLVGFVVPAQDGVICFRYPFFQPGMFMCGFGRCKCELLKNGCRDGGSETHFPPYGTNTFVKQNEVTLIFLEMSPDCFHKAQAKT